MQKLNILIITPYFHPENFRINDLAIEFKNKNHQVSVLTPIPNYPEGKYYDGYNIYKNRISNWKGIKIYRSVLIPRRSGTNLNLAISWVSSIIGNIILSLTLLKNKYDIIFVFGPSPFTICLPAIFIKKLTKTPICFWVLDLWPESVASAGNLNTSLIPKLLMPLVRFTYNSCDKILVSSPGFIKSIKEKNIRINNVTFFPQWAEPIFRKIKIKTNSNLNIPKGSFIIMFAGNIGESQDFPSILKAANQLKNYKNIHWVILGSGRKEKWVKQKIEELGISDVFHMLGRFPLKKMPEFYSVATAMLISLSKKHIFSLTIPAKLQSYLACGKPILAMIDGATAELVKESNAGFVCNSENSDQLAKNILTMSKMSNVEINTLATNSFNLYMDQFNREVLLNKLESIFYKLKNKV